MGPQEIPGDPQGTIGNPGPQGSPGESREPRGVPGEDNREMFLKRSLQFVLNQKKHCGVVKVWPSP